MLYGALDLGMEAQMESFQKQEGMDVSLHHFSPTAWTALLAYRPSHVRTRQETRLQDVTSGV